MILFWHLQLILYSSVFCINFSRCFFAELHEGKCTLPHIELQFLLKIQMKNLALFRRLLNLCIAIGGMHKDSICAKQSRLCYQFRRSHWEKLGWRICDDERFHEIYCYKYVLLARRDLSANFTHSFWCTRVPMKAQGTLCHFRRDIGSLKFF